VRDDLHDDDDDSDGDGDGDGMHLHAPREQTHEFDLGASNALKLVIT
jgi:hypothetical protein